MKSILFILSILLLTSCTTQRYFYPSKGSRDYADLILKEGSISADHIKATLISVHPNMKGNQHIFLTDSNDSIVVNFYYRLDKNKTYWLHKNYLK